MEHITSTVFVQHLLHKGVIQKSDLLVMNDKELDQKICETLGCNPVSIGTTFELPVKAQVFSDLATAKLRQRQLLKSGIGVTFIDAQPRPKPATKIMTVRDKTVERFDRLYPHWHQEILEILGAIPEVRLYYIDLCYQDLPSYYKAVADSTREVVLGK